MTHMASRHPLAIAIYLLFDALAQHFFGCCCRIDRAMDRAKKNKRQRSRGGFGRGGEAFIISSCNGLGEEGEKKTMMTLLDRGCFGDMARWMLSCSQGCRHALDSTEQCGPFPWIVLGQRTRVLRAVRDA
ncbi:MAG: hypothetical protein J3Q66DRAFT_113758 [Benniella sp.]|nr:MAG: hypothetical protein J3Q66DRAFT_113758 [Benniella sp.]